MFDILEKYDLTNRKNLAIQVRKLSPQDWEDFSYSLENNYKSQALPRESNTLLTPLSFCTPSLPIDELQNASAHLIIADQTYIDDPLYDIVVRLGMFEGNNDFEKAYVKSTTEPLLASAEKTIDFYLQAQELIAEKKLIPYKQLVLPNFPIDIIWKYIVDTAEKDKKFRKAIFGSAIPIHVFSRSILSASALASRVFRRNITQIIENRMFQSGLIAQSANHFTMNFAKLASFFIYSIYGGLQGLSVDFMTPENVYIYRKALDFYSYYNEKSSNENRLYLPASFSQNIIQLPVISSIPVDRVLDCILKERHAFETFRSSINEKLSKISAPPNTIEREKEILAIRESINHDVADITIAYNQIQKSFAKKFITYSALGSASIIVAGLSTIGQNLDALSLAGGIFAGTTFGASIKDFAKEWLDYQQELLKLKARENFFVWKISKGRK